MKLRSVVLAAVLAGATLAAAGQASAQAKVFVVNEDVVRAGSKVGKDIEAKLGEMQTQGVEKLGLKTLSDEIKTAETALAPQTQNLTREALDKDPALKTRVEALAKKQIEFQQKSNALNQNLGQQSEAASLMFLQALAPAVEYVAKEVGADVVVSSSSAWYIKENFDISKKVIARLDATTPSLELLQQTLAAAQQARQPNAAPAPARQ
ncbi:hypothetical protein GC169_00690 [bacterium]|nr:hypothetical protein [bacterium]